MNWRDRLWSKTPAPVLALPWRHIKPDDYAAYELSFGPDWQAHNRAVWDAREQVVGTIHNTVAFM